MVLAYQQGHSAQHRTRIISERERGIMSDQNAIVTQSQNKIESPTIHKAREFASRLKFMIVNGNKLEDREVYALAHYSAANGLNPFAQEAYYLPGTGPVTGIVGYRRKAQEALNEECEHYNIKDPQRFWVETREATPDEALFDANDIAVFVTLHDSLANKAWRQSYFETARELKALGEEKYFEVAKEFVGKEPVWTGVGVVYASESFSAPGKKEKFDRFERAAKRGEKIALKKRFPSLQQFESAEDDHADAISVSFVEQEELPESVDVDATLEELGYAKQDNTPDDVKVACDVKSGKGIRYGDIATNELNFHLKNLQSKGDKATDLDSVKAQAILTIKAARAKGVISEPGAKQPELGGVQA
jgi:hypothetical protein